MTNNLGGRELSISELAYAAGIIDGEGSIGISAGSKVCDKWTVKSYENSVRVEMAGNTVTDWLKERFGGSVSQRVRNKRTTTMYCWKLNGSKAEEFLKMIYPFLVQKTYQADIFFAFRDTVVSLAGPNLLHRRQAVYDARDLLITELKASRYV